MAVRVLILNDNRAHPNWGAQASPVALEELLRATLPDVEIAWLSWDWLRSSYHRVRIGPLAISRRQEVPLAARPLWHRLSRRCADFPDVADDFGYLARRWMRREGSPMVGEFLDATQGADILVYNGENSLYRNTIEGTRALFLLWLAKVHLGMPSCIVNHTVHVNDVRPIMNAMIRKVHPTLDLVACRETRSWQSLKEMGIENARLFPDVVFWLKEKEEAAFGVSTWLEQHDLEPMRYVCMSASGLPVSKPMGRAWDGEYAALVRRTKAVTGLQPVLMARDPDCQFLEEVARRTGSAYFGPEHHFTDLWPLLRQAAVLISGHFHYVIIAASVGCPFVPLSANNHKMQGVCEQLGWPRATPYDVTDLANASISITVEAEELVTRRPQVSPHLVATADGFREQLRGLGSMIGCTMKAGAAAHGS